jgi:hypothetical protein
MRAFGSNMLLYTRFQTDVYSTNVLSSRLLPFTVYPLPFTICPADFGNYAFGITKHLPWRTIHA